MEDLTPIDAGTPQDEPEPECKKSKTEPECKKSKTGRHCWHPTGNHFVGNRGSEMGWVCCFCDAHMYTKEETPDPSKHGKYLPAVWWLR